MGWKSPTGGSGTGWSNIPNAYDEELSTYALGPATSEPVYDSPVELTVSPLLCDRVRFYVYWFPTLPFIKVEVYYEGGYHEIYIGTYIDKTWIEKDVIPGSSGQAKVISKMRLSFMHYMIVDSAKVYEAYFNAVMPRLMKYYKSRRAG